MKTNRFLKILMIASIVGMVFCSCGDDDILTSGQEITPVPDANTYTMTVEAQKATGETRNLWLNGATLKSGWSSSDVVKVYKGDTKIGELTPQSIGSGHNTTLKGYVTVGSVNVGDNLTLKYLSNDYNSQNGTLTGAAKSLDNVCDYSIATVSVESVSYDQISTSAATFVNQQAVVKFTLKKADGSAFLSNPTAFTMSDGTSTVTLTDIPAATYTTNGDGVLYVAFPGLGSSATIKLEATVGTDKYEFEKTGITFNNSNFYSVTVNMKLRGKFLVGSGKWIYFSKGNLQLVGENTWKFADNQWDYFGDTQADNHRDVFGWGTGNSPNLTSQNVADYSTFTDWGSNTSLQSSLGTGWRTLSNDEWTYIFNTRSTESGVRYAKAQVNGVNGVILIPGYWQNSYYSLSAKNTSGAPFTSNVISSSDWKAKFEAYGAVFLPAAGGRDGTTYANGGNIGVYWSSTHYMTDAAYYAYFNSSNMKPAEYLYRYEGMSVRLVQDFE